MKRILLPYLIINLFFYLNSFGGSCSEQDVVVKINDGPYIFSLNDTLKVKWVENSILKEDIINPGNFDFIKNKFSLLCTYKDLTDTYLLKNDFAQSFKAIDSIAVITDVHGEYHSYINLLKASGIIDANLNWKFGKGHLVVLGDCFDRGDMVTEVLWHLFGLEKQAVAAGGMVHVLLGNHEVLVLSKDETYINDKYRKVEEITKTSYSDLYPENSVLGRWLRSKPVMMTIDDIIFVHGGISMELVKMNLSMRQINKLFYDKIVGKDMHAEEESDEVIFLDKDNGPLWYRGYFTDSKLTESRLDSILSFYSKKHIVVGHTTIRDIKTFFNNKIFGVDAGIMNRQPGEMLIYKNGSFYKGYVTGERIKL
jgi:hypothetical protein